MKTKKKQLLAASVVGILAMAGIAASAPAVYADVACSGVNACKGKGDCGSKAHSCAGQNACKGQGWVSLPSKDVCDKIGGKVTENPHG